MEFIALEDILDSGLRSASKLCEKVKGFRPNDSARCINNIYATFIAQRILSFSKDTHSSEGDCLSSTTLTLDGIPLARLTIDTQLAGLFQKKRILQRKISQKALKRVLADVEKQSSAVSSELRRVVKQARNSKENGLTLFAESHPDADEDNVISIPSKDSQENERIHDIEKDSTGSEETEDQDLIQALNAFEEESHLEQIDDQHHEEVENEDGEKEKKMVPDEQELDLSNMKDAQILDNCLGANFTQDELDMLYGDLDSDTGKDTEDEDLYFGISRIAGKRDL